MKKKQTYSSLNQWKLKKKLENKFLKNYWVIIHKTKIGLLIFSKLDNYICELLAKNISYRVWIKSQVKLNNLYQKD